MATTYIRFSHDCSAPVGQPQRCADGCCFWFEYENEAFKAGQEVEEDPYRPIDLSGLEEKIDYLYLEK